MSNSLLVTGGAGFIGSHFLDHVTKSSFFEKIIILDKLTYAGDLDNIKVHLSNNRVEFIQGDIVDAALVEFCVSQSTHVVHFAAETHVTKSLYDSRDFVMTDVVGTHNILTAIIRNRKKIQNFLQISTSEVYGTALNALIDENHPLNPLSPYAGAKCGADRLVYSFLEAYQINGVILRPFNNYGPRQHLEKLIPRIITSALSDLNITIHGDGSAKRDWVSVEDTVFAANKLLMAQHNNEFVYNFGTGKSYSVYEIAREILEIIPDSKSKIVFMNDRPGQVSRHTCDSSRILNEHGLEPKIKLAQGLKNTVEWYVKNEDWWRKRWDSREILIELPNGKKVLH